MTSAAFKYPKTMHLPFSPGLQNDDRKMDSTAWLENAEVVVTEKMDGENTTMYSDNIHARSIDGRYHPSRDWVKGFHGTVAHRIPPQFRVCGENMYAEHSIRYDSLETYFYGFSVWNGPKCLGWDDTLTKFDEWGITPVPVLWRGVYSADKMLEIADSLDLNTQEGFVVRTVGEIWWENFGSQVGKYVRPGHVQTDEHWMHKEVTPNGLKHG